MGVCERDEREWFDMNAAIIHSLLLTLALCAIASKGTAQYPTNAGDLRTLSRSAQHDTTKAQALLFLAVLLRDTQPDTVLPLCEAGIRLVEDRLKKGLNAIVLRPKEHKVYRRIKATSLLNIGHYYHERGDAKAALKHYELAHTEFDQADFRRGAGDALASIGALLSENGSIAEGTGMANKARTFYERTPDIPYGSIGFRAAGRISEQSTRSLHNAEPVEQDAAIDQASTPDISEPARQGDATENLTFPTLDHEIGAYSMEDTTGFQPMLQDSSTSGVASLTALGINTAVIIKYRDRLSKPITATGGDLEAREHLEMGEALELVREPALALSSFKRSLAVFSMLRSDSGECIALLRIGKLRGDQNAFEEAFAVLDSARQKARNIGRRDLEGIALVGMGDMCRRIEECGGATELYRRSIELAHAAGDRRTEARGYLGMTEELLDGGSPAEAEPLGQKGLDIATEVDDADLRQQGALLLRGVYSKLGRVKEAQVMGEIAQLLEAFIVDRDRAMDSIILVIRNDLTRTRVQDSLIHSEVRSALESNLKGEQVKAKRNRSLALIIAVCALVVIVVGLAYYRFDRRRRQARAQRLSIELEIKALRAQMNPHFLFNALSSIHDHILENEAEIAAGYLVRFGKLMRHVLEMSRLNEVPLQRELDVLGMYTELERMRLKGRFSYAVDIALDVDPEAVTLPPMLLQPFVENAVWHGLSPKEGQGHIQISVSHADGALRITIEDNGVGRSVNADKGSGHTSLGTSITKERLELWAAQSGATASFSFVPVLVGTHVLLVLPWDEV